MLWFKVQVMVQELALRVLKGSELQAQSPHYIKNHIYSVHDDTQIVSKYFFSQQDAHKSAAFLLHVHSRCSHALFTLHIRHLCSLLRL